MGQIDIRSSVTVTASADRAWEVISDFSRNPEWQEGMQECTWLTDPPLAIGSRYQQRAEFLGREILTTFEVVELEPGSRVTIDTVDGSFPIKVTRTLEQTADGTIVSAHVRGNPGGLFGLLTPLMRRKVKRAVDGDYRKLKDLLEAG